MSNSVRSSYLKGMTDDEIRTRCAAISDDFLERMFPGHNVSHPTDLDASLAEASADFEVAKRPLLAVHGKVDDPDAPITSVCGHVATARTDTNQALGVVSDSYGVVQTQLAMQALDILAKRGDLAIKKVECVGNGARVRVSALLGMTSFTSADGAPNTLGHFAIFEATHDGSAHTAASVFTLRLECFNGMTSRSVIGSHKLRHTSRASDRAEKMTQDILATLIGDVEAERELFLSLVNKRMSRVEFQAFATELLDGEPDAEACQAKRTRFQNQLDELCGYFDGGNQGAGDTAWGAYNSVTRWLENKRERLEDSAKAAAKFNSNTSEHGSGQRRLQKAVRMLQRRDGTVEAEPTRRRR